MKNECFNVALTVTGGAVVAFFVALGYFTRAAYLNGFADGFEQARERFKRIIKTTKTRDVFREFENEIDADGTP